MYTIGQRITSAGRHQELTTEGMMLALNVPDSMFIGKYTIDELLHIKETGEVRDHFTEHFERYIDALNVIADAEGHNGFEPTNSDTYYIVVELAASALEHIENPRKSYQEWAAAYGVVPENN